MTDKPMTVGDIRNFIKDLPDDMEILTINPKKSLIYSSIIKAILAEPYRSDKWATFVLKET